MRKLEEIKENTHVDDSSGGGWKRISDMKRGRESKHLATYKQIYLATAAADVYFP